MAVPSVAKELKNLAKGSVIYGIGIVALRGVTFLLLPLYTRYLTPADYGVIALATTMSAIFGILCPLGLNGAITRFYFDNGSPEGPQQSLGTIWATMVTVALCVTVVLDQLGATVFSLFLRDIAFTPYIRLALWTTFCNVLHLLPLNLFQLQKRPGRYVLMTAVSTLLSNGLIIGLVVFYGQGAYGYLLGVLLAAALLAFPYVCYTLRNIRLCLRWPITKAALLYGLPLVPHGLAGWVLELSDRVILEHYVSLKEVGLYALGYQVSGIVSMAAAAINTAWVPFLYTSEAPQDEPGKPDLAQLATYYTFVLSWVALGLVLLGKDALQLLTAPAFHEAYRVMPWLVGGLLLGGLYLIPANFLFLRTKTGWISLITVVSGSVNVGLNLWLVPRYGLLGAAWATLIAYASMLAPVWIVSQRVYPLAYEYKRLSFIGLVGCGLFVVGRHVASSAILIDLVGHGVLWLAFPVVLYGVGFFTRAEKALALASAQRLYATVCRTTARLSS